MHPSTDACKSTRPETYRNMTFTGLEHARPGTKWNPGIGGMSRGAYPYKIRGSSSIFCIKQCWLSWRCTRGTTTTASPWQIWMSWHAVSHCAPAKRSSLARTLHCSVLHSRSCPCTQCTQRGLWRGRCLWRLAALTKTYTGGAGRNVAGCTRCHTQRSCRTALSRETN